MFHEYCMAAAIILKSEKLIDLYTLLNKTVIKWFFYIKRTDLFSYFSGIKTLPVAIYENPLYLSASPAVFLPFLQLKPELLFLYI